MSDNNVIADAITAHAKIAKSIANALTPLNAAPAPDESGAHVGSVTEALMGITAGLMAVSRSLSQVAEAIRETNA